MSKLTERESEVVRWILREVDARDAVEPRPAFEPNEKLILAAAAAFVIVIVIVGTLAWMGW